MKATKTMSACGNAKVVSEYDRMSAMNESQEMKRDD
jgi:hypothetical protein